MNFDTTAQINVFKTRQMIWYFKTIILGIVIKCSLFYSAIQQVNFELHFVKKDKVTGSKFVFLLQYEIRKNEIVQDTQIT